MQTRTFLLPLTFLDARGLLEVYSVQDAVKVRLWVKKGGEACNLSGIVWNFLSLRLTYLSQLPIRKLQSTDLFPWLPPHLQETYFIL